MTILELLQSEETPCRIQGHHTQIIRNPYDGKFEVLQMTNYELKRRLAGNIISAEDTLAQMRHTFEMLPDMPIFFHRQRPLQSGR